MKQTPVIQLGDMKKLKVDTFCVTVATTSHIRVSNQGWFFRSCTDCSCKADGSVPPYKCKKGHMTSDPPI
ncbi:replication factor A protein, partial [Trifolium medium]|nr:replication factor A protein [Trifolium medium]